MKTKAAFIGFGEVNTPRDIIIKKCKETVKTIENNEIELVTVFPVTDDSQGIDIVKAVKELSSTEFDVIIVCIAGWIPSHAVISVVDHFRHIPMILLGLTGWTDEDRFITTADQAGTTALRKTFSDLGYTFKYVVTYMGSEIPIEKIKSYAIAARAVKSLRGIKIGQMGNRDMNLYGTLFDGTSLRRKLGIDVEFFDLLEMQQQIEQIDPSLIKQMADQIRKRWKFVKEPKPGTIEQSVKLFLALNKKIKDRDYAAFSLSDVDGVKKLLKFAPAGVFMMIHDENDICTIPENDVPGNVTQLICRSLTGQVGAYLEFYEFLENGMLMGVPDYVPAEVIDGDVTVMPTAFGDFGEGLLNVSKVKTGKLTLARLVHTGDQYTMHITTGTGNTPRKWEEAGWTPPAPQLPSLEIILDGDADHFHQNVMCQHYIITYGNNIEVLKDFCNITGINILIS